MLRKIRIFVAIVVFTLITLLFLDFTGTLQTYLGWLAEIQFIPAVLALNMAVVVGLVVITLLLGRVYCSVICPMGVFQDIISWLHGKRKRNRFSYSPARNILRYIVLALFVASLLAGFSVVYTLLAPYSSYGRIVSNIFAPVYQWSNNLLAYFAERADSYAFYNVDVWLKSLPSLIVAAVTLVIIIVLAWSGGRTYCNTICPVGTILGFLSKWSLLRPAIDTSKCNGCGLCARNCKSSCINPKEHKIDYSRCVACMDCIDRCRQGAIKIVPRVTIGEKNIKKVSKDERTKEADDGRRGFLSLMAVLSASAVVSAQKKKVDGGLAVITEKKIPKRMTPITPAGSVSMRHFSQHCTACQLCISECPNQVLRPSSDLSTFMQPVMSYERGYCRPECTRCADVCPSNAIQPITKAEKSSIQIGKAVWVKDNCVVLTDGVSCGNCSRHCPSGAIQMVPQDGNDPKSLAIPVVDPSRCIGCGACENLCPARPFSAIYVEGHETHRTI